MKDFKEILSKGKKIGNGPYKDAKLSMLKELLGEMNGEMGNDIKGLQKVTVAAPSQEGLEEGLEKAKEVVEELPSAESEEMPEESMDVESKIKMLEDELMKLKAMIQK